MLLNITLVINHLTTKILLILFDSIILGSSNFGRNLPTLFDPSEKCIVALSTDLVQKSFNLKHLPYRRLAFTKDRLFMLSVTFNFRKKSMLTHVFNHQLTMLREAGLIDFWVRSRIDDRKLKSKHREPSKLHMENIFAAFQICGFMCFISFIIFILEVISVRCRHIQSIIDYMTYWFVNDRWALWCIDKANSFFCISDFLVWVKCILNYSLQFSMWKSYFSLEKKTLSFTSSYH